MLSKRTIKTLSSLLKVKEADIEAAIAAEAETDLPIAEDLKVFTVSELDTRDKSIKSTSYNDGKNASAEILIKELKTELGLTHEGKDKTTFVAEVKKLQAKPEGVDVEALRNSIKDAERKATDAENALKKHKLQSKVASFLPKNLAVEMSNEELLTILTANGFGWEEDEHGNVKTIRNGQELKDDKLQTPVPIDAAISSFFKEKKWLKEEEQAPAGRGGGSSKSVPMTFTKLSEVTKKWQEEGKNTNGAEFLTHVNKIAKENPDFDYDT